MSFNLKNLCTTYHRMMKKVFKKQIRDMLGVDTDDMIIKFQQEVYRTLRLKKVFEQPTKPNMRFISEKCMFEIVNSLMNFYLSKSSLNIYGATSKSASSSTANKISQHILHRCQSIFVYYNQHLI
jgi:hypothetical protein